MTVGPGAFSASRSTTTSAVGLSVHPSLDSPFILILSGVNPTTVRMLLGNWLQVCECSFARKLGYLPAGMRLTFGDRLGYGSSG